MITDHINDGKIPKIEDKTDFGDVGIWRGDIYIFA